MLAYQYAYYKPTYHFFKRYKQRMTERMSKTSPLRKQIRKANFAELTRRANFMLLFSIHGEWGDEPNTEIRYYFGWNIVVNNKTKDIITMYFEDRRAPLPARLFGDRRIRDMIYDLLFRPKSKISIAAYA